MSELFSNPAVIALVAATPSLILGILAYRKSRAVDKVTERTQEATERIGGINQLLEGMDKHIRNLQEDNKGLRESLEASRQECREEIDALKQTQSTLMEEIAVLKKALAKDLLDNPRY